MIATRSTLLASAKDELERRLHEPTLAPRDVAARISISTRYLQRLFQEEDDSFTAALRRRRLERCLADLRDPDRRHWSVAEIAVEHGFNDPSYMARAFRLAYGCSPRDVRLADAGLSDTWDVPAAS